ncbi:retrovirus-related pol polyprotein from transposon TNT 1-94 [Tanacetum coccineum]
MSSMQEDIQCAGSDTRPPMLDRTDFESWQQCIRLYCLGKDNGENIMKCINEGPFHMGTVSDVKALLFALTEERGCSSTRTGKLWFKMSMEDTMRIIKQDHFRETITRGNGVAGNVGGQNRGGIINPGQAKPIKCYNCNGLGHIARECPRPKRLQDSDYFKDKMLLMQAQESGAVLDEEQSLFLAGEQVTNVDDNVDDSPENDLALNVDHVFEADECDAFDSDVDEGPITQTMFMTNLTSEDLIYDEAGTSYDSNTPSEYMEDNEDHVVQRDVSSVRNDALMSILDEMHEQGVQSRLANKSHMVVNDSVTSELARYKELVGEYEKRAKFELTDRERKIDEQMRIIISDRNRKETSLKSELHSAQILLSSTVDHYKSKTEEVTLLKKDFKQKEDKFLEEFLDIKKLKDKIEDRLYKQDQSVQTVHMLCQPKSFYDEKHKVAIGYKNPLCLARAKQAQSALYNGHVLVTTNHAPTIIHDSEDTLELAEITRNRMRLKMQSPQCVENKVRIAPHDYSKENLLATFAPQRNLTGTDILTKHVLKLKEFLLIENENLIVNCLSTQLLYDVEKSRCLDLEADMSKVHDESKLISKLEREYLNLQLKYQHLQESFDNKNSQASQEAPDFNSFFKIKNLEHQIKEKDNVIRHLKDLVASVNDRSREPYNAVDVTALIEQNDCDRVELEKVKQHYKELYDSIKITRAHTSEKTSTMLMRIESLSLNCEAKRPCLLVTMSNQCSCSLALYVIALKPSLHPLRTIGVSFKLYQPSLRESVETVREIVEEARVVTPLDISLNYACRYTKLSQELLECVIGTCQKSSMEEITKSLYPSL